MEQINIYTLEELSPESMEKALEIVYDELRRYEPYPEDVSESMVWDLEQRGYRSITGEDLQVQWSFGGCQGDGASFTGHIDLGHWINHHPDYKWLVHPEATDENEWFIVDGLQLYHQGYYVHKNTMHTSVFEYEDDWYAAFWKEKLDDFEEEFLEQARWAAQDLEKVWDDAVDRIKDPEYLKDVISHREIFFFENGEICPPHLEPVHMRAVS